MVFLLQRILDTFDQLIAAKAAEISVEGRAGSLKEESVIGAITRMFHSDGLR